MRACLILAFVVACLPAHPGADTTAPQTMRFETDAHGGIIVPVFLNGFGPFRFLLDTGSTHSSITERVAAIVNAPPVARVSVGSAAGEQMRVVVRIDRMACGPLVMADIQPAVVDVGGVAPGARIEGVLGQDALAPVRYTIDFRRHEIAWWPDDGSAHAAGTTLALEASNGRFVVSLPQHESVLRLVPDSGAETLLLFDSPTAALPPMAFQPGRVELTSLTAHRTAREARVLELLVGPQRLRNVRTVVVGRQPTEPAEHDGLLPLHLFGRVTFDGPRGLLTIEG